MLQPQVAMAVAHVALLGALGEAAHVRCQKCALVDLHLARLLGRQVIGYERVDLREVLLHVLRDDRRRTECGRLRVAARVAMERREPLCDTLGFFTPEHALGQANVRTGGVLQAAHVHGHVQDIVAARLLARHEAQRALSIPHQPHHAVVDVRREPAIERHLGQAGLFARGKRAKIQKAQRDGTLGLEHFVGRQIDA